MQGMGREINNSGKKTGFADGSGEWSLEEEACAMNRIEVRDIEGMNPWEEPIARSHDTGLDLPSPDEAALNDSAPLAEQAEDESNGADDALGLYLRQMGAIPLLTRDQELALASRLEYRRSRYRRSTLFSWRTISRVIEHFEKVMAGQTPLDPSIDVVTTLGLNREKYTYPRHLEVSRNNCRVHLGLEYTQHLTNVRQPNNHPLIVRNLL